MQLIGNQCFIYEMSPTLQEDQCVSGAGRFKVAILAKASEIIGLPIRQDNNWFTIKVVALHYNINQRRTSQL